MEPEGPPKKWVAPRMSFGPIPSPRHSATTWTADDRFFYVYGGHMSDFDQRGDSGAAFHYLFFSVYCCGVRILAMRSMTWEAIRTTGESPELEERMPWWACYGLPEGAKTGFVYNLTVKWKGSGKEVNDATLFPMRTVDSISIFILDTASWKWEKKTTVLQNNLPACLYLNSLTYRPALHVLTTAGGLEQNGRDLTRNTFNLDLKNLKWNINHFSSSPGTMARMGHQSLSNEVGTMYITGGTMMRPGIKPGENIYPYVFSGIYRIDGGSSSLIDCKVKMNAELELDGASVVLHAGKFFFFGGHHQVQNGESRWSNKIHTLNTASGAYENFKVIGDAPIEPRAYASMQLVKDSLVIFGGKRGDKILGDLGFVKLTDSDLKFICTPEAYHGAPVIPKLFLSNPVKHGLLEVNDQVGNWYVARILDVKGDYIRISFEGALPGWDELLHVKYDARRIRQIPDVTVATLRTVTSTTVDRTTWPALPKLTWVADPDNPNVNTVSPSVKPQNAAWTASTPSAVENRAVELKAKLLSELHRLRSSAGPSTPADGSTRMQALRSSAKDVDPQSFAKLLDDLDKMIVDVDESSIKKEPKIAEASTPETPDATKEPLSTEEVLKELYNEVMQVEKEKKEKEDAQRENQSSPKGKSVPPASNRRKHDWSYSGSLSSSSSATNASDLSDSEAPSVTAPVIDMSSSSIESDSDDSINLALGAPQIAQKKKEEIAPPSLLGSALKTAPPKTPSIPLSDPLRTAAPAQPVQVKKADVTLDAAINNPASYPDITLRVGGKDILCHKIILSSMGKRMISKLKLDEDLKPPPKPDNVDKKKKSKGKGKQKDTEKGEESGPEVTIAQKNVIDLPDFNFKVFMEFLTYIYKGSFKLDSRADAREMSQISFEYLLDEITFFAENAVTFPAIYKEERSVYLKRIKSLVGSPIGSDISFVFNKKHRLCAHKVFVSTFCEYFAPLLEENKHRKYVELTKIIPNLKPETLADYLKLIYCGWDPKTFNVKNAGGLLELAIELKEQRLLSMMAVVTPYDEFSVGMVYTVASAKGLDDLAKSCRSYIGSHFSRLIRNINAIEKWPKELTQEMCDSFLGDDEDAWNSFANWLDIAWFALGIKNEKLLKLAQDKLKRLVNYENAISILVCAHAIGDKDLRSRCVDYMVKNSVDVEKFQRMKELNSGSVSAVSQLSESLMVEVKQKVIDKVGALREERKTNVKVSPLKKKQRTCVLCKRVMAKENLRPTVLPSVFGFGEKERVVCLNCGSISQFLDAKPKTSSSGSLLDTASRSEASKSQL